MGRVDRRYVDTIVTKGRIYYSRRGKLRRRIPWHPGDVAFMRAYRAMHPTAQKAMPRPRLAVCQASFVR